MEIPFILNLDKNGKFLVSVLSFFLSDVYVKLIFHKRLILLEKTGQVWTWFQYDDFY